MKLIHILLFFTFFSFVTGNTILGVQKVAQKQFSILGIGDSITEGSDYFSSYLYPLWEKLYAAGYSVDFIGPRESHCRIGKLNHCGFSGKNIEFLESKIDSIYRLYPADIVLLHAGHNHFIEENPIPQMIASYKSLICKIQAINPDVQILIARVIPSGKLPKYSYIPDLNKHIADMVKQLHSEHVHLVNMEKDFNWKKHTIKDKVHPNKAGAEKMAEIWFKALKKIIAPSGKAFAPQIVKYKVLDKEGLTLHIFTPADLRKKGSRPAIVYFFGGGWQVGTPLQFYRECAYYASKGMVAVAVDYRISYLHHSTPFDSFDDAKDAMRWLRLHTLEYNIDPDKIVASGASAGGHLAAALGTIGKNSDSVDYRPNLLVLYYPVVDNSPAGYGPSSMKKEYKKISPLHNITAKTPPTLFIIGTKDPLVPVETAREFEQRMKNKKVDCELHLFYGAGHPIFLYRKALTDDFYKIREITDNFLIKHGYLKKE